MTKRRGRPYSWRTCEYIEMGVAPQHAMAQAIRDRTRWNYLYRPIARTKEQTDARRLYNRQWMRRSRLAAAHKKWEWQLVKA